MKLKVISNSNNDSMPNNNFSFIVETSKTSVLVDFFNDSFSVLTSSDLLTSSPKMIFTHTNHSDQGVDLSRLNDSLESHTTPIICFIPKIDLMDAYDFTENIESIEINPAKTLEIEDLTISFHKNLSSNPSYAVRFSAADLSLVYTPDTAYHDSLAGWAYDADILLASCGHFRRGEYNDKMNELEVADLINGSQPLLTLLVPDASVYDKEAMLETVKRNAWGAIELVEPDAVYDLNNLDEPTSNFTTLLI
ncbi:hypothetical protein HZY88_03100 [Aerococcaceae bacterium DSM 111176]|nr:hypothetical protein [Aerococcaceae bacterium DSM 111176]